MTSNKQPASGTENKDIPAKKQWQKPDFEILDSCDINAKSHPYIFEHTGHVAGGKFVTTGFVYFVLHKSSAFS